MSDDVTIGDGKLAGRGVYAARDFKKGELVMTYKLKELSQEGYDALPKAEKMFAHSFWGKIYLYPEPARYVNHSAKPNTRQDLKKWCDYATRDIKKGEMITTNATLEIQKELDTFLENYEKDQINNLHWQKAGYRNAACTYAVKNVQKSLILKRIDGNWHITDEKLSI